MTKTSCRQPRPNALAKALFVLPWATSLALVMACPAAFAQDASAVPTSTPAAAAAPIAVQAIRVTGVGEHPRQDITPQRLQALADARLRELGGQALPAQLSFAQLQQIADALTQAYRQAGFLVARAYLPVQTIGADRSVEIRVAEGRVGKITVEGTRRYDDRLIASPALALQGQILRQQDLQSALLYARDLPGVSVTSVLKPGAQLGETDVVIQASEDRPLQVSVGASNYGTESIGRYRAQLGVDWNNPLGLGDHLSASYAYALDPANNWQGSFAYQVPIADVDGLSVNAAYTRSLINLDTGAFAALGIQGPTQQKSLGLDWKFRNTDAWRMQAWLHLIQESSRIQGLGVLLSKQKFDVVELGAALRHDDRQRHAIDALQLSVRSALDDDSQRTDYLYAQHDRHFLVARLAYTRLQGLTATQRLQLRLNGQYSDDALTPLEQFSLGGPTSVRAFALGGALGDRGFDSSLEYQIDAPGFAGAASPFGGRPWDELLTASVFYDYGRVYPNGANRAVYDAVTTFQGPGVGLNFRLPHWQGLSFDLAAAKPTGGTEPADGKNVRYWARFGLTF
ncbi:ShlB/FhaC/HecB family hemolysin secretion/activation protein [Xanthomonas sp. CFBP 8703]|uniref:ShlB/FhaC/HecB family hemolysin secretion/activation protein n=1 Tax=Xanthomonas bonasiae TaxID=2810351 RepID=A0ABS3B5N1_9XANT|nr:ShlB/FhaC/HecB family hemolysin secretion/activation protein [Xanthomonas bonasiae]